MARDGSTAEPLLNAALARLLRRQGLRAEAEQHVQGKRGARHQIDLLVELEEYAVAIEAEFAPARTVKQDAMKRLPPEAPLYWCGLPVYRAFTLVYPAELKATPESLAERALQKCKRLQFAPLFWRGRAGEGAPEAPESDQEEREFGGERTGSVAALAETLHSFWLRAARSISVDDVIHDASQAIEGAAEVLRREAGLQADKEKDPAATIALIWLNALLFQELLARDLQAESMPPEHAGKRIQAAKPDAEQNELCAQWRDILEINWWPIFSVALNSLQQLPSATGSLAVQQLIPVANRIAARRIIRRHDVAGRILHRLLTTRKFLATNYTTIPAAVLLAGLAFDEKHPLWRGLDWNDSGAIKKLRIVDPACGTGTLLMAAVQEVLKKHRRASPADAETNPAAHKRVIRTLLENTVQGFDVVPAAVHLTTATLSMAESGQIIRDTKLFWMPHDVKGGRARLGSLDFLANSPGQGQAQYLPMFPDPERDPSRRTGGGERVFDAHMPPADLIIANPPFTRAGGPGSGENERWNPIFGSALSAAEQNKMNQTLQKTLQGTAASVYAGLGSAFVVLADERLKPGGRFAFVLPATALTGSRWAPIRKLLLDNYHVEWVVVSHDPRTRPKRKGFPGRRWVSLSESTRIAEAIIVATKRKGKAPAGAETRFVNLRNNPDEPLDAAGLADTLLAEKQSNEIVAGGRIWGELHAVAQRKLDDGPWLYSSFVQGALMETALALKTNGVLRFRRKSFPVKLAALEELFAFGPYHMQIKNPKQGLFNITETEDPTRLGYPALWHHKAERITQMECIANARLRAKAGKKRAEVEAMLDRSGNLHIASVLGHAPQRFAAVITDEEMLGVSSWTTLKPLQPAAGKEEAMCLWLNCTPGMLLRLIHANRPYLGRSGLPHELARTMPVLNVDALSKKQLRAAKKLFADLKGKTFMGFAHMAEDPARRELDRRLFTEVLGADKSAVAMVDALAEALNREPAITARN